MSSAPCVGLQWCPVRLGAWHLHQIDIFQRGDWFFLHGWFIPAKERHLRSCGPWKQATTNSHLLEVYLQPHPVASISWWRHMDTNLANLTNQQQTAFRFFFEIYWKNLYEYIYIYIDMYCKTKPPQIDWNLNNISIWIYRCCPSKKWTLPRCLLSLNEKNILLTKAILVANSTSSRLQGSPWSQSFGDLGLGSGI